MKNLDELKEELKKEFLSKREIDYINSLKYATLIEVTDSGAFVSTLIHRYNTDRGQLLVEYYGAGDETGVRLITNEIIN
jgi:predicted Zn-dependent peptidase